MLSNLSFPVHAGSYLKDPTESELGKRILHESIQMIDDLGLEHFTFKKLAKQIGSTEASVYRYFENKYKLLVYLANWYWSWLQAKILKETYNQSSKFFKLERTIELLASPIEQDEKFDFIDEKKLYHIIISQGAKVYLIKEVDEENSQGAFLAYKSLCAIVSELILNINPNYKHSHTLASTIVETCHNQIFFSEHLPRLTDLSKDDYDELKEYITHLTASALRA
ncbi:MAG: TetR/AcrR family transcriptional regulator [Bacteroidia bacterium]|nr:TetR/AcrR family transcriptional regulator [Bacteroidia bacterium]